MSPLRRATPIRHLRWWIGGMLFAVTVINYLDRQTLNALGPYIEKQYKWSNTDMAFLFLSFRVAYTIMQTIYGRVLDRIGTRRGLSISVGFYSVVAALTSLAQGFFSFCGFRFMLGAGEAANNPGASKVVSEWFPAKERAIAAGLYDSGSAIGAAIVPFIVLPIYKYFGSWRPAFCITALLGFIWLIVWRKLYRKPEEHPRISAEELEYIRRGQPATNEAAPAEPEVPWFSLLRYRQTWGIVLGRFLLDPYWFLVSDWFAIYLVSMGFDMEKSVLGYWAPFLGAALGNLSGGALSSLLIRRGWAVGRSRRTILMLFGPSMLLLIPAAFTHNYVWVLTLFLYASFAYSACSTMFLTLPTDVFHKRAVGSVMGMGGTGAGLGVIISTYTIGKVSDMFSFAPIVIVASIVPCIATLVFVTLVRANKKPDPKGILQDF